MDKIICIGKNYRAHAEELGEAQPELPVIFLKPPSILKQAKAWNTEVHALFPEDQEVVPECELVLELGRSGMHLSAEEATGFVRSVTVGLDVTLRVRQRELKRQGQPWTTAKVFPDAAIIGPWIDVAALPNWIEAPFFLKQGAILCQHASAGDMLCSPTFLIAYISQFFPLCAGDIIFTGTPAGLKPIYRGTEVELGLSEHSFKVWWL